MYIGIVNTYHTYIVLQCGAISIDINIIYRDTKWLINYTHCQVKLKNFKNKVKSRDDSAHKILIATSTSSGY